jgi:protein-disulfide isomerase
VETEPKIIANYVTAGKVKLVYRHLAQIGEGSVRTAEASECAADQGQFWPMHDTLYARQDEVFSATDLDATLVGFAQDLRLDTAAFKDCMQNHTHLSAIQADYQSSLAAGIRSRPVFDFNVNGRRVVGAQPFSVFQKLIDAALAQ